MTKFRFIRKYPSWLWATAICSAAVTNTTVNLSGLDQGSVLMLDEGTATGSRIRMFFAAGTHQETRFKATAMNTLLHNVAGVGVILISNCGRYKPRQGVIFLPFTTL